MKLFGNYTSLITPFTSTKNIDFKALKNLLEFQLKNKADGIVLFDDTGEQTSLTEDEKHRIMLFANKVIMGAVPVIAGVCASNVDDAIKQIENRKSEGANAILLNVIPYVLPSQKGIENFYLTIANKTNIPIIICNDPHRTGVFIEEKTVLKLSEHQNIIGIKDCSKNILYAQNIAKFTNKNFCLICGSDDCILPMISLGTYVAITTVGNIMPDLCHYIFENYYNGEIEKAKGIYFEIFDLINTLNLQTNPTIIKYALFNLGLAKNIVRLPLIPIENKNRFLINNELKKYYIVDY